jgi:hypothetical protein
MASTGGASSVHAFLRTERTAMRTIILRRRPAKLAGPQILLDVCKMKEEIICLVRLVRIRGHKGKFSEKGLSWSRFRLGDQPEGCRSGMADSKCESPVQRSVSGGANRGGRNASRGRVRKALMVAEEQCDRLVGKSHQPKNLVQFFRQSPLLGVDLHLEREHDPGRDIEL